MFGFNKRHTALSDSARANQARRSAEFGIYQVLSSGQRTATGERSEMCSGAMNNNQRFATLQILRNMRGFD